MERPQTTPELDQIRVRGLYEKRFRRGCAGRSEPLRRRILIGNHIIVPRGRAPNRRAFPRGIVLSPFLVQKGNGSKGGDALSDPAGQGADLLCFRLETGAPHQSVGIILALLDTGLVERVHLHEVARQGRYVLVELDERPQSGFSGGDW